METSEEYLRVKEAAALFGFSEKTVYRWVRAGTIPYTRAGAGGKIILINRRMLERELLESCREKLRR